MRLLLAIYFAFTMNFQSAISQTHNTFTSLLHDEVYNGKVNYKKMKNDPRLNEYIHWLAEANPDTIKNRNAELAFWYNAYNAYTLKLICDNYPVNSINELHTGGLILGSVIKTTAWDKEFVIVNHKNMTLNTIEHKIVRPLFKEPRSHFALVCASKSCPPLRNEAYEADKLEEQLQDQGKQFFNDTFRNKFDLKNRKATISSILKWYSDDFGGSDEKILRFLIPFLQKDIAHDIRANVSHWRIEYLDYDWTLNE